MALYVICMQANVLIWGRSTHLSFPIISRVCVCVTPPSPLENLQFFFFLFCSYTAPLVGLRQFYHKADLTLLKILSLSFFFFFFVLVKIQGPFFVVVP